MSWLDRVAARAGIEPNEQQNIEPPEPEQDSAWKYINAGDISGFADWTNRNMNYRDIPFLGQLVGHTVDAAIQGVADLAQFAGAEGVGNYLNEKAQEGESRLAPMSTPELSLNYVTDPNGLTSAMGMLLGSMLPMVPVTMLVPEAAALRAGALLKGLPKVGGFASEFAPKAVKWAATGPIEAAMEGGNTERQMLESGASREEANRAKWDAFKGNVALLTATNALEGGLLGKVAKVKTPTFENGILNTASKAAGYLPATAAESALQGYEEGAQQGIQEGAMSGAMDLNHILNPNAWNDEQWENAKFAVAGGLPMVGGSALIRRFGGNTPTASANELLEQAQASTAQKLAADSAPAQAEVATAQPAFGLVSDAATETQAQSGNALPTYDQKFYTIADEVSDTALDADTEARLNILAHDYQEQFGEPLYVTSMKRNGDGSSWHDSGQAFDIAGGGLETNENGEREWLIQRGQALGLTPLDEYAHPSEHATGGHIHFSNHEDGSAPSIGGTQGGAVDVSSLTGGNIAMAISQRTGLPAQFIWAQMAHESANFQSDLARKDHNYAGVKGTDGEYLHFDSDEDFVNYMADYLPEYSNNGIFNAKNVDEYAQALKDGGYFGDTVENYAGDMKNILSRAGFSQSGRSNLMNDKPSFDINRDDETGRKMVADFVSYWSNATDNADDMNELETMLDRNGKFRNTPENRANVREKFGDAYQQFADARMQEEAKKQEAATQAATPSAQKPVQQAAGASPNAPSDLVSMQTPNLDQTANRKADTNAPTNQTQGFTMEDAPQAQAAAQPSARPQSAQQNANQQGTRQNTAQNVQTQTATTQPSTQSTTPERNTQQASTTQAAQQANAVETALMHFGINKVNDLERANGNTSTPESMRLRQALQERNTAAILSMYPQEAAQAVAPVLQPARPARQQKRAQRKETNATPLQLQQGQNLVTLARQNNVKLPKGMVGALMRGYGIDSATKELAKHGVAVPQQTKGETHESTQTPTPAPAQSRNAENLVQHAEPQPRHAAERREEDQHAEEVSAARGGRGKSAQNATKKAAPKGGEKSADEIREELIDLAAYAWVDKKFQGKVSFRPSEKLNAKLEELFGHTVDEVFITADDVRHLKNNHSNGEERRGQRSLVAGDVASIYDVVNDFDGAEIQRSDNKGNKTALFWKTSSGKMFTLLIERGKRKAEVKTAYDQNKKETSPMPDAKSSSLNVRNDSAKSPSASSIPQEKTEKQSEKPSDADDFHGYLATKAPNIADTIRTALAKNINPFGGKGKGFMTLKRIVEDYARGDLLYGKDSSSKKGSKYYLGSIDVTKGGYEYYQYLKEHTPEDWKTEIRKMRAESAARNAANRTRDDFVDNKISYEDAVARINAAMDEYAKVDKNTAERDRKWNLERLDSINRDKHPEIEAAEKVAADKAEREAYHGFLDNKTNLAAGNAKKALSVRERRDGQALTRKDYTEQAANDQAYNMEKAAYKGKTQYRLFRGKTFTIVTKTEYDYFNYLRDHAGKAPATNPKESPLTLIKKAEAIGEAQYDGKQSPQDALAALDVIADATDNAHVKERVKKEKADITARVTEEYKTARASIENFASSNGERRPMIDGKSYATLADYMKALREKRKNDLLPDQFDKLEAFAKRTAQDMERTAKPATKAEKPAQDSIFGDKDQADRELLEELGINPDEEETLVAPEGITNTAEVRAQLEKELSAELNKISANPVFNPKVYELGVRIAFTYVKDGMNTAKKLIATFNEKFGDAIAPWSPAIVETVRTWPQGVAFDAKTVRALSKAVGAHYEQGTQTREGIHAEMKELFKGRYDSYAPMIDAAYNGIEKFFNAKEAENNGHGTRPREGADRGHEVQQPREVRGTEEEGQPRGHRGGVPVEGEAEEGRVLQDDGEAAAENAESVGSAPGNEPHHDGDRGNGERGNHELAALRDDQANPAAEKTPGHDYTIEGDGPAPKTPKQRFDANVEAIKLLKQLEAEGRMPTPAEQSVLAAYSSWGGLTKAFQDGTKENTELRKLLTKEEYDAAKRSILDAYFTPPAIVRAIWKGVSSLGFKGGRVLDPSMGVGNFFGCMPESMRKASALTGVEIDDLSSRFANMLYPSADVEHAGFQNAHVADDSCDLVISNVPFSQAKIGKYALHNYFFANGIDKVRPGGLMVFITSQSSLTSGGDAATMRAYLNGHADLIGGFKLPSGVFKGTGTDVATDVLVFQKRGADGKVSPHAKGFTNVMDYTFTRADGSKAQVPSNKYFYDNPGNVLGKKELGRDRFGKDAMNILPRDGQDTAAELAKAMAKLPNVYEPVNRTDAKPFQQKTADKKARADEKRRDMEYFTDGGKLYQNQDGVRVAVPTRKAKAVKAYLGVRESLRTLFLAENDPDAKPSVLDSLRKKLNQTYDAFVKAHGFLNEPKNVRLFGDDPSSGSVLALESDVKLEGKGAQRRVVSAQKAGIFHQRTVQAAKPVTHADNAKDALLASLNQTGKVDVDYMAKLTGKPKADVIRELGDTIYQDPATETYETADEYLSGNVREKLAQAQKAAKKNHTYQRNVDALKKVVPADLVSSEILVNINSPWIPVEDLNAFMEHLTGASATSWQGMTIARASNGRYVVDGSGYGASKWKPDGAEFRDLIDSVLNNKPLEVAHKDEDGHRIVDQEKTDAANAAADRIRDEFQSWIWSDKEREQRLVKYYNENYNGEVLRTYDGSHLTFPGMNSGVKLRGHQKNVIWRMLQKVNTLIAHCVGAGKTWEMQAAGMEMRRLGIANKPLYCVPNNIVEQFAREFQTLYPNAKLLVLKTGDDLPEVFHAKVTKTEDGRKVVHELKPSEMDKETRAKYEEKCRARLRALTRIKTEDWDGIIMSHNMFERLPVSGETTAAYIKEEIAILEQTLKEAEARKQRGKNANGLRVRDLQTRLETLKSKLEEATNQDLKAVGIPFEELGIDQIFVDEADMFKNLHFMTTIGDVSGLTNPKSANRSTDMFIKTQWLTKRNGGRGVVFATGTPISNTMAEMYTMMRYLDSAGLKERGVELFDNWIRQYGDIGTGIERKPSGDGYRKVQKVKHFLNMPELTKAFRKFTDVFTRDELIEEDPNITIPKLKNDKRTVIALAPDPAIVDYIKRVVPERIKNMKGRGKQKKGDDNMLALTNDLRKLSMTDKKIDACAEQVAKKYRETDAEHGAQAIFCDMGVPRAEKENATSTDRDANESAAETENKAVYDRLIASLVAHGIPREQIAFAQQAKNKQAQDELFQKVDRGDIRVIIGTTQKMGAGTNFQRHLAAEHHLDAPWRPRDIEQREGRILRQGNGNKEVEIFTYVVKDSFDANMWEKIKNKASIISQAMSPNIMERSLEDADLVTLSYADVESAATGNPYIKQMLDAKADVSKLTNASTQFQKQQHDAERKAKELPATIKNEKNILALIEEDKAARIDTHGDKFQMEIAGKTYDKRADADKALDALPLKTTPQDVGHIGEYRIRAWVDMGGETHAEIVRNRAYPANKLNAQSIERALRDGVDGAAKAHDGNIKSQQQELKDAKDVLKEQNPYTEKLKAAREQQRQLEQKINDYMTEKPQATDTAPTASATPTETEAEPKETFDVNKTPFYISGSYISYDGKLSKETYDALEKLADKDGADKGSFFRNEEDGNFSVTFNYRRTNTKRDTFIRDAMKLIEQDKAAQEAPATSNTWREILSAPTKNELAEKIRKHLKSRYLTIGGVNADGTYHVSSLATYKEISDGVVREVNGEWQFGKYEEAKKPYNLDNSLHVATADNRKWFDEHVHVAGIPDAHYRKQTEVNAETETEKKRRELKEVYEEPDSRVKINGPFLYLDGEGLGHAQIRNMRGMLEDLAQGQARSLKAVGGSKMLGVQPKFQYYISNNYSLMMRIKEAIDKEYPKHSQETKAETSNQPSKPTHYEAADVFRSTAIWNPAEGKMMPNAKLGIEVDDFVMNTLKTLARNNGRRGYYEEQGKRFFFPEAKSRDEFVKTATDFINKNTSHAHYSVSEAKERVARTTEDLKREIAAAFPDAKNVKDEGDRVTFDMPNGSHVEIRIRDNMTLTGKEAARARRDHGIADGVSIRVNGSEYTLARDVVMELSRRGDVGTAYHEALHAAMDILFDDKAKAALHKKYGSEEKIADAYRKFMLAEQRGGHVPFAKLFRAIRDFFRGLASHISPIRKAFGDAWTAQKAFEDLASGKAWETKGGKRSHGFSLFSVAEAAENPIDNGRGRGDNEGEERAVFIDRFLNEKIPEEGRTRIASDVENGITTYAGEITPENIEDVFDSLHCVKMLRSTFLDKGRMESYDNGLEYAKNMAAYMYGYARRCFENDERIQRQLALRGASLGRPETVRDLNAQGRAGRSNAGTPRNGGQTYKGTSLAKHGNVTALQEVYDQLIDEEYSKHEKHYSVSRSDSQDGFSDAEKTPSDEETAARGRSFVKAAADKLGKALHLKSDKIMLEEDSKDPTKDINLKQAFLQSPSRVAAKVPVFRAFYTMACRAMDKNVGLRNDFNRKFDGALAGLKKAEREELFDTLLKGDAEGKEWTRDDLIADGASEAVADAYIKIRRQLNKAYHLVDKARRKPEPKSKSVTEDELKFLRENKFVDNLHVTDKGIGEDGKHRYLASYMEARNYKRAYKGITADRLAAFQADDGIQVVTAEPAKSESGQAMYGADGKPLYNVITAEGPAHLNKLTGYIPHFFHEYMIRVVDKDGKARVVGSARNQREAIKVGEAWPKENELADGEEIHVAPKVFDINKALGVNDADYAPVMGDRDFYRVQANLAKQNDMTLAEAKEMLDGAVRLKGRHRFFGNAMHRTGAQGYETDLNWALRHYFNSASRYVAMETEFKPKAISYFERMFGAFDKDYTGLAKYCKDYINDINGNPSALEEAISKALNSTYLFKKVIIPTFGDRAALTLGNGIATKVSYLTLGLNMSSALLNFTQLTNAAAYIGDVSSLVTMVNRGRHHKYSRRDLRILHETGVFNDIGLDSGSGYDKMRSGAPSFGTGKFARGLSTANRVMDFAGNKSMMFFREADAICRRGTVLAAYEKARKEGKTHAEAIAFAKEVNNKANFQYGVQDAPNIFRRGSIVSQLLLQFKKYGFKELEVMADFAPWSKVTNKKQKLMFWAMYAMLCGAMGVPALDWLDEIFGEKTGFYTKDEMQKAIIVLCGSNKTLAAVAMYGVPAILGMNISSRAGLSDVIPTSLGDFAGPTASKSVRLAQDMLGGDWANALRDVSPGLYNLYAGYTGEARGKRGRLNDRYDTLYDKLLRAVGFRSVEESVPVDMQRIISRDKAALTKERQAAQDAYIENPTSENKARLKELGINPKTVTKEAQKKQQTREERMEGSVSKKDAARYKPLTDYAKGW